VLGAGGGARAVVAALAQAGAPEIRVCNRSFDTAQALVHDMGAVAHAVPWAQRHAALAGATLLVNTTNQGMAGQPPLDLALDALGATALVSDLVYVPLATPLLAAARARGNPVVGGLGMLLQQARPAFHAWFGVLPQVSVGLRRGIEATL
jgi:shikimate dehydrogenase